MVHYHMNNDDNQYEDNDDKNDVEMAMPGDNVVINVELGQPVAMEEGLTFAIREGGRTIGSGRVIEVVAVFDIHMLSRAAAAMNP